VPELQNLQVGDLIRMTPAERGQSPFTVAAVEPERALVLRGRDTYSWVFVLNPVDAQTTRLIVRVRCYTDPAWLAPLLYVEPVDFVMERGMLLGLKARAERAAL
jgi:hypothetical protein